MASNSDMFSSDVRVYHTLVGIHGSHPSLKPGRNAEVTIFVDERENVLRLPVHAVVESNEQRFCYVRNPQTAKLEKREIKLGLSNNHFIEVAEGSDLKEGESVVMNARSLAERLGDLEATTPTKGRGGRGEKGKGKAGGGESPKSSDVPPLRAEAKPSTPSPASSLQANKTAEEKPKKPTLSSEDRQKLLAALEQELRSAAGPMERKAILDARSIPDPYKARIRQEMKGKGIDISD
jgi:hypothetical protein